MGLSYKSFFHPFKGHGYEVMLQSYQIGNLNLFGYMLSGFYEYQKRLPLFENLGYPFDYYYGAGLHFGYYSDIVLNGDGDPLNPKKSFSYGPDIIFGIEKKVNIQIEGKDLKLPLVISLDFKVYYEALSPKSYIARFFVEYGAVSVRYVFE